MKETKDKNYLYIINMCMQMIFTFYTIFFSIYVYEISNDINLVLGYSVYEIFANLVVQYIITKLCNHKHMNTLYRISFLLSLVAIVLTFLITASRLYMVFVIITVYSTARMFYYIPHEIAIMNKNQKSEMKSFVGINSLLAMISGVLSPFISGYIIDFVSYYILFTVIGVLAVICFIVSFKIKNAYPETPKITLRKYISMSHKNKRVRISYLQYGLYRLSMDSVITILLPLLLFLKVGTNLSVGLYSALGTLVSGVMVILYLRFCKNKNLAAIVCTILIVASSLTLGIWTTTVMFFIYYFVNNAFKKIITNITDENLFVCIVGTEVEPYKKEHHMLYSLYGNVLRILAYGVAFLIYNLSATVVSLSIIITVLTLIQIPSTVLLCKLNKKVEPEIVIENAGEAKEI